MGSRSGSLFQKTFFAHLFSHMSHTEHHMMACQAIHSSSSRIFHISEVPAVRCFMPEGCPWIEAVSITMGLRIEGGSYVLRGEGSKDTAEQARQHEAELMER